jgi:hypothetical protein
MKVSTGLIAAQFLFGGVATANAQDASSLCAVTRGAPAPNELVADLQRPGINKGMYESTDAYMGRLSHLIRGIANFTAVIPVPADIGKYDPDAQRLTIEYYELEDAFFDLISTENISTSYLDAQISTIGHNVGSYIGENSFGVKRTVTVRQLNTYGIAIEQAETAALIDKPLSMDIPRESAKQIRPRLRFVIAGSLTPPFTVTVDDEISATVQSPTDLKITRRAFTIKPKCGAIVDGATGNVLATFDPAHMR